MNARSRTVPCEPAFWIFILGDLCTFGLFFCTILYYRADHPEAFAAAETNLGLGLSNTFVLLLSSLLVVGALQAARRADARAARRLLLGAAGCGLLFAAIKAVEYLQSLDAGHDVYTNGFYLTYFTFTGIHLVHVLVGAAAILLLLRMRRAHGAALEGAACYWHMVDAVWLVLFPLFYLLP